MANITETAQWEAVIREIATTDPVVGGPTGPANVQAQQLANRTAYLKDQITQLLAGGGGGGGGTVPNATELAAGIMAIATQAETNAGTIDNKAVTPLKLANAASSAVITHEAAADPHPQYLTQPEADALYAGLANALTAASFPVSLSQNGYQQLPSGLIIQWGFTTVSNVTFPIAFPNAVLNALTTKGVIDGSSTVNTGAISLEAVTTSGMIINAWQSGIGVVTSQGMTWLAIGH